MKKLLQSILMGLMVISATACKHPGKEAEITAAVPASETPDESVKNIFVDTYGEKMEVTINETKNTATIHLNGKTYDLKKNKDLPEYTATNTEYLYSNIRGNITFLKKDVDMVLFHLKHDKKEQAPAKMASY
ncbi:hypothetical protein [Chryseobacterium sp. SIMBA_029]|uniref:hypothetical protein n=1 Tax=Chryseobacterium sp. SIMBA_029 TaxID=3085772 RepID=UPI00397E42AA